MIKKAKMGVTLSTDFNLEYGVYREIIDKLDKDGIEKSYEKIMRKGFSDLFEIEAVCRLIFYTATTADTSSIKYSQLAKKLENETEGGINRFGDVFQRIVKNLVSNYMGEAGKLQDQKRKKTAMKITEFLAILFNNDVINEKDIANLVRKAKIKNHFDHYVKHFTAITKEKMNSLGYSDFDAIQTNSSANGSTEMR